MDPYSYKKLTSEFKPPTPKPRKRPGSFDVASTTKKRLGGFIPNGDACYVSPAEDDVEDDCQPLDQSTFLRVSRSVGRVEHQDELDEDDDRGEGPSSTQRLPTLSPAQQTKLSHQGQGNDASYWKCLYRKPNTRKNKSWENDAVLIVKNQGRLHVLRDVDTMKNLAQSSNLASLALERTEDENQFFKIGAYEAIIEYEISEKDFLRGNCSTPAPASDHQRHSTSAAPPKSYVLNHRPIRVGMTGSRLGHAQSPASAHRAPSTPARGWNTGDASSMMREPLSARRESASSAFRLPGAVGPVKDPQTPTSVDARSFYAKPTSKSASESREHLLPKVAGLLNPGNGTTPKPKFDPDAMGAIVMKRPDKEHQKVFNKRKLPVVDVVIDPVLTKALRPHQVEGVKFLYERVMGMRIDDSDESMGAILGDEMGLGKTLQTITLISTLLTQSCYYSPTARTIDRALIVCPLSLVKNWTREFTKWIGNTKINVKGIEASETSVESLVNGRSIQVIVIGYERMRTCVKALADAQPPFGLVVCDEGHRLKSLQAKTTQMFSSFNCPRRIILTGTPIQNDLSEFYAMFDFVAPGLLDSPKVFKRAIEDPIMRSRQRGARQEVIDRGRQLTDSLQQIAGKIMLRRTAELLSGYLPPKHELVVFCSPSKLQLDVYNRILESNFIRDVLGEGGESGAATNHLTLTGVLRKLCNTPELLLKDLGDKGGIEQTVTQSLIENTVDLFPRRTVTNDASLSGKLLCLFKMLKLIRETTSDKVVIVSNFTKTLDILEAICRKSRHSFVRMDGTTRQTDRMRIINDFNRGSQKESFVFLLSSKTGGTGINLIGANRLILVDSDWNPAIDRQAMARIHRDGQKKHCYIYRLLVAGTMDEKIYERQISKLGLSDSMIDSGNAEAVTQGATGKKSASDSFSIEELRDIFRLHLDTPCISHDQLGCSCGGTGVGGAGRKKEDSEEDGDAKGEQSPVENFFIPASQVAKAQKSESEIVKRAKLAALLDWGHHDFSDVGKLVGQEERGEHGRLAEGDDAAEASRLDEDEGLLVKATKDDVLNMIVEEQKVEMLAELRETVAANNLDIGTSPLQTDERKRNKAGLFFSSQSEMAADEDGGGSSDEDKTGEETTGRTHKGRGSILTELDAIAEGREKEDGDSSSDKKVEPEEKPSRFDLRLTRPGSVLYVFSKSSKSAIVEGQGESSTEV